MADKQIALRIGDKEQQVGVVKGYEVSNFLGQSFGVFHGFTKKQVQDIIDSHIATDFDKVAQTSNYSIKSVKIFVKIK